jgi:hypothetical protein
MGDAHRIDRISRKITFFQMCIIETENERNSLNRKLRFSIGNEFLYLFQEVAELDQIIFNLKKEKQRLQNLLTD